MNDKQHQELITACGYPNGTYHAWLQTFITKNKCHRVYEVGVGGGSTISAIYRGQNDIAKPAKQKKKTTRLLGGMDIKPIAGGIKEMMTFSSDNCDFDQQWHQINYQKLDLIHFDCHCDADSINRYLYVVLAMKDLPKFVLIHDWILPTVQKAVRRFIANNPAMYAMSVVDDVYNGVVVLTRMARAKRTEPRRITVQVPSGIGDITWVMQKLSNANVIVDLEISGEGPKRGKTYAEMFKCVDTAKYNQVGYQELHHNRFEDQGNFEDGLPKNFVYKLTANSHLELGNPIHTYLSAYPTTYELRDMLDLPEDHVKIRDTPTVAIYPSSYKTNQNWQCGTVEQWVSYIESIADKVLKKTGIVPEFYLIGATYDRKLCHSIKKAAPKDLDVNNTCGKTEIGYTLSLIEQCDYLLSFPSGIGITASMLGVETLMFMPSHLKPMEYKWMRENQTLLKHVQIDEITNTNIGEVLVGE